MKEGPPKTIKEQQTEGNGKTHDNPHHLSIVVDQKAREAADQKIEEWEEGDTDFEDVCTCTLLGS